MGLGILIIGKPPIKTVAWLGSMMAPMLPVGGSVGSFHIVASTAIFEASMAIWADAIAAARAFADSIAASSSTAISAMSEAIPSAPATTPPTAITFKATSAIFPMVDRAIVGASGIFLHAWQMSSR